MYTSHPLLVQGTPEVQSTGMFISWRAYHDSNRLPYQQCHPNRDKLVVLMCHPPSPDLGHLAVIISMTTVDQLNRTHHLVEFIPLFLNQQRRMTTRLLGSDPSNLPVSHLERSIRRCLRVDRYSNIQTARSPNRWTWLPLGFRRLTIPHW